MLLLKNMYLHVYASVEYGVVTEKTTRGYARDQDKEKVGKCKTGREIKRH